VGLKKADFRKSPGA